MKFFISKMEEYCVVNNKGLALQKWLKPFAHRVLPDELSKDAFLEEIRQKMTELDGQYSRSRALVLSKTSVDGGRSLYISVYPKETTEKTIVRFCIHKIVGVYRFNEKATPQLEKGGLR